MFLSRVIYKEVREIPRTAVAKEFIKRGSAVCSIKNGKVSKERGRFTIQVDKDKHIEGPGTFFHSCDPNCYWDFKNLLLIAKRNINAGEPITFNYCTTEYTLVNNFTCKCRSPNCFGEVKGFKYLTPEQRKGIEPLLSPYLNRILYEKV